ncbi:MAG: rhodanese-like domain-containing protein [Eubacterium aggregans]|uniref:Rhodanese-related sulfurtransferase n=1 Tax=Eubacterium aggregans TaxID=81409 RepID=A0A1H3YGG2_9FIRM|nr:rhodanese-like domain-containing protein [Eubacterium aggregans]MDD4692665.1 rhodanese-like domain-containing protein [Eubacterium aggregans]MEA5073470.1 rhodanese-like domain-containing protein [Eubacterium aggregans]SEA10018.1 Rhodanese-related sulfurtransferase [Eubacterium aggregans]
MKVWIIVIVLAALIGIGGWLFYSRQNNHKAGYETISSSQAKGMMDTEQSLTIVDVREPDEYAGGHIQGAINIPLGTIGNGGEGQLADKQATLLVYCRSGNRSRQAAEKLVSLGYDHVYDFGGVNTWTDGLTTE